MHTTDVSPAVLGAQRPVGRRERGREGQLTLHIPLRALYGSDLQKLPSEASSFELLSRTRPSVGAHWYTNTRLNDHLSIWRFGWNALSTKGQTRDLLKGEMSGDQCGSAGLCNFFMALQPVGQFSETLFFLSSQSHRRCIGTLCSYLFVTQVVKRHEWEPTSQLH